MRKLPRVLVVEDESAIAELIAVNLRHNGFAPTVVYDGEAAQREVDAILPDVILLDWMLPGESGVALAKRWRQQERIKTVPIILLTARTEESDKVQGLDAGADDYITKPFSTQELLAPALGQRHPALTGQHPVEQNHIRQDRIHLALRRFPVIDHGRRKAVVAQIDGNQLGNRRLVFHNEHARQLSHCTTDLLSSSVLWRTSVPLTT